MIYFSAHVEKERQQEFLNEVQENDFDACEVVRSRDAEDPRELTIFKGEILEVLDSSRNWWLFRNAAGKRGYAPKDFVRDIDTRREVGQQSAYATRVRALPQGTSGGSLTRKQHEQRGNVPVMFSDTMDEWQHSLGRKGGPKVAAGGVSGAKQKKRVILNQNSTPEDVKEWMMRNDFTSQ